MRTIIAGSRTIQDFRTVEDALSKCPFLSDITEVVSGCAMGVDRLGELWAKKNGIPIKQFPAQWDLYGKSAGFRRNEEMAEYAEACCVIWDGKSRGALHMANTAKKKYPSLVYLVDLLSEERHHF